MAKKKHKSIAAAAVAAPTRRPRKGPRPSVEIVEISSGGEDGEEQERFGGVLRGLNPKNVLAPTEQAAEGVVSTQTVRHGTRQSYHGKTEANYSMKVSIPIATCHRLPCSVTNSTIQWTT